MVCSFFLPSVGDKLIAKICQVVIESFKKISFVIDVVSLEYDEVTDEKASSHQQRLTWFSLIQYFCLNKHKCFLTSVFLHKWVEYHPPKANSQGTVYVTQYRQSL